MPGSKLVKWKEGIKWVRTRYRWLPVMDYRKVMPTDNVGPDVERLITQAWDKTKSGLGYTTFRDVQEATKLPYAFLFGILKRWEIKDPYSISFNINRMGACLYFKIEPPKVARG